MRKLWFVTLWMVVLLMTAVPVFASDGRPPGQVVFGTDFTLESGETLDGDLVVFGGDVTLEEGSRAKGSVVVLGGDAEIAGEVGKDVVALGGDVHLAGTARVDGGVMVFGGKIERDPGAQVRGEQVVNPAEWPKWYWEWWVGPWRIPMGERWGLLVSIIWQVGTIFLRIVLTAALAGLVALFWPRAATRVGQSALQRPLPAFGMGLLTLVVGVLLAIGLIITLCLSPIGVIMIIALALATLFGWLALGILIGERLMPTLTSRTVAPFWTAALGAGLLTLISELLGLIPCAGWAIGFLLKCVALGAVVLTRFGTVEYPAAMPSPVAAEE